MLVVLVECAKHSRPKHAVRTEIQLDDKCFRLCATVFLRANHWVALLRSGHEERWYYQPNDTHGTLYEYHNDPMYERRTTLYYVLVPPSRSACDQILVPDIDVSKIIMNSLNTKDALDEIKDQFKHLSADDILLRLIDQIKVSLVIRSVI